MKPTKLSPVYVVQRLFLDKYDRVLQYFDLTGDTGQEWISDPKRATFFDSLVPAARVAASEGAQIRVLVSEADAKEFGID